MQRKVRPIDEFRVKPFWWRFIGESLIEEVQRYDRQNEEYNYQKLFKEEQRFGKIDIKKMTEGRSVEFTQALIISELSGKSADENWSSKYKISWEKLK